MPFDAGAVRAACTGTHVFPAFREEEQEHVRLDCEVRGLPEDVFFLELVPGESLVDWVDGTRGSIHSISHQGRTERSWSLYLLTTPPPLDPGIRSARIALRVHQSLRADRHEAAIGIGEVALFDFGVTRLRWVVTSDLRLTEFGAGAYRKPISPALDAGLRYDSMVRLVDAGGIPLREEGGGGAGTQFINEWAGGGKSPLVPPVRVVVEVPSKTSTTQVVVTLADIRPKR
jgi:hypothetical protein